MYNTKVKLAFAVLIALLFLALASSFSSYSYVSTPTYKPDYQTYYTTDQINTYWPVDLNEDTCRGRQDLILQPALGGCQPAVVRSDLLEEQNVPVFCQLSAIQLNPLIDIKQISNIRFNSEYPSGVVTTGFHPARAALSTRDQLLGDPLINNVGYAVVVLKRTPSENDMPNSVSVNLTATIEYDAGNGFGIGRSEFILKVQDDKEWAQEKNKNSFLSGRLFARLESVNENSAVVSIYDGDRKMTTKTVPLNGMSDKIYLPGSFCTGDFQIQFDGYSSVRNTATLELTTDKGSDNIQVYEGSRFLNNKCYVSRIIPDVADNGRVIISCNGQTINLLRVAKSTDIFFNQNSNITLPTEVNGELIVDFGGVMGIYGLGNDGNLFYQKSDGSRVNTIDSILKEKKDTSWLNNLNNYDKNVKDGNLYKSWLTKLQEALRQYRLDVQLNPSKSRDLIVDNSLGASADAEFNAVMDSYKKVFKEFPFEKEATAQNTYIAQNALSNAIALSITYGKIKTEAELLQTYIDSYPNAFDVNARKEQLSKIYSTDVGLSSTSVDVDHLSRLVRLVGVQNASNRAHIDYSWEGKTSTAYLNQKVYLEETGNYFVVDSVDSRTRSAETVSIYSNCTDFKTNQKYYSPDYYGYGFDSRFKTNGGYVTVGTGDSIVMCGKTFVLRDIESENYVNIKIIPEIRDGETVTNVSLTIGIEKRAISLNPDKALERIHNLNESIEKWNSISNRLAKVVTTMKSACFVTAGALTFKNFVTGLSGETIARQQAMQGDNGWTVRCQRMIAQGTYGSLTECFNDNSGAIDSEVSKRTEVIGQVNSVISPIEDKYAQGGGLLEDQSIDSDKAKSDLADIVKRDCSQMTYANAQGTTQNFGINTILNDKAGYESISYTQLRDIYNSCLLQKKFSSDSELTLSTQKDLATSYQRISDTERLIRESDANKIADQKGLPLTTFLGEQKTLYMDIKPVESVKSVGWSASNVTYTGKIFVTQNNALGKENAGLAGKSYFTGLRSNGQGGYEIVEAKPIDDNGNAGASLSEPQLSALKGAYNGLANVQPLNSQSYVNKYLDPQVRFYENEPYKGMPATVPLDLQRGWYAGTRQTLPTLGGIGAFDSSGRVTSFWLCNVGKNGLEQFDEGLGDDICQQFNLNTGQPINVFPGLSEETTRGLVNKAVDALNQAARQYSNGLKRITISGVGTLEVGAPSVGVPGTNCQDFMSPDDCKILFNVCDPVICPASRCNLGGAYPVADVIQSGIVGSAVLCLPNAREGVAIPVCLTGIQAGIDSYVSILEAHRDCLQESVDSGEVTGICDELYSIYACEFFWRQAAPVANLLIPKMIEYAYTGGQGGRGGAEYLSVQSAWSNAQKSVDYLTQNYAQNAFKAFNVRSTEEVGSAFCKNFISARGPSSIKSLVEPDSPPQFHASFSSIKYSDATVPATSQYKVFYHIFAGKDSGVYYSVYLKGAAQTSFYNIPDYYPVDSGFITRGDYRDETRDFTAPEGYKELCVRINDQEECGFSEVSSSFAVNYIRDKVEQDNILETNINSEQACISGSVSLSGALGSVVTNANPQAAFEDAVTPADYKRGIIRICSTENPGSSTDPTRFTAVGNCGDAKITCWLDQKSVDNAITSNNIGVQNQTLSQLEEYNKQTIDKQGFITENDAASQINAIKSTVSSFSPNGTLKASQIIDSIDGVYYNIYFNHQKAELLFLKGFVLEKNFTYYHKPTFTAPPLKQDTGAPSTGGTAPSNEPSNENVDDSVDSSPYTLDQITESEWKVNKDGQAILVSTMDQFITMQRTDNGNGYSLILNRDESGPITIALFVRGGSNFQISQQQQVLIDGLADKNAVNDLIADYKIVEDEDGLPMIIARSTVSTSPATPVQTFTLPSNINGYVFEFQDGTRYGNLYYRFDSTEGWQWSHRDDFTLYSPVSTNLIKGAQGRSQTINTVYTASGNNAAFLSQMNSVKSSFGDGLLKLMRRTTANSEGGLFSNTALVIGADSYDKDGVFSFEMNAKTYKVQFNVQTGAWEWQKSVQSSGGSRTVMVNKFFNIKSDSDSSMPAAIRALGDYNEKDGAQYIVTRL